MARDISTAREPWSSTTLNVTRPPAMAAANCSTCSEGAINTRSRAAACRRDTASVEVESNPMVKAACTRSDSGKGQIRPAKKTRCPP